MTQRYLLDTNVVSEIRKPQPNPGVVAFLDSQVSSSMFASALTLGEIRRGIAKRRRTNAAAADALEIWIDEWEKSYADRILSVDGSVARMWGNLPQVRTLAVIDSLLAATALAHGLTLVTRNTADIADLGVDLLNPWLA